MRAQFASLWNLLQECRSLEPRAGKIALHRPESFLTRRIERNARCLNVAFTIPPSGWLIAAPAGGAPPVAELRTPGRGWGNPFPFTVCLKCHDRTRLKQKKRINKIQWQTYLRANIEHQSLFRPLANPAPNNWGGSNL